MLTIPKVHRIFNSSNLKVDFIVFIITENYDIKCVYMSKVKTNLHFKCQ